ncbi:MAG: class I SAM-dependent methyltransferase [Ignavibacteriales bacterium]|nr:MAG: class I SAM-dependent methyltransferase [Ignavibacteriales bacterium]
MTEKKYDFRKQLYDAYVTTFKNYISNENNYSNESLFAGYKKRYLKYLSGFSKNASVIDIGCGNGLLLQFLYKEGFNNLYGIDISDEQINIARSRGLNADSYDVFSFLTEHKKKYDIVFAMDVIEHLYKKELFDFFRGIHSILNENGLLIIQTPNGDGISPNHIIYGDLTHLTIFNPNSLSQILRLVGFDEINSFETGPTTKGFLSTIRLILWKIIRVIFMAVRIIETGGSEKILTQDFTCTARKRKPDNK